MKEYHAEIVVAGGGPAGVCAAIAAGRAGKDVLLVEQYGCLGGMSTSALVTPWMTFHEADGKQLVYGIAQEIVDRLVEAGRSPGHVADTMGENATVTPFDPEFLKLLLADMCREAGVRLLFHTFIFGTEQNNRRITALRAANKDGEIRITADSFIDATGDGDLMAYSGCAYAKGRETDSRLQPATMCFSMENVDFEQIRKYMQEHHEEFHFRTHFEQLDELPWCVSGFFSLWEKGKKEMGLDIQRDRLLFFRGFREDIATVNTTRLIGIDGTSAEDLSLAETEGRRQVFQVSELMRRYIPGFEKARLLQIGSVIGIRETRRLQGRYILTAEDLKEGRMFDDNIMVYGYTIDFHQADGAGFTQFEVPAYGIPYRTMLPFEIDNLLVAGRCVSATMEANSSMRLTPCPMSMGQAAGLAAALRPKDVPFYELDVKQLQDQLRAQNAYLG